MGKGEREKDAKTPRTHHITVFLCLYPLTPFHHSSLVCTPRRCGRISRCGLAGLSGRGSWSSPLHKASHDRTRMMLVPARKIRLPWIPTSKSGGCEAVYTHTLLVDQFADTAPNLGDWQQADALLNLSANSDDILAGGPSLTAESAPRHQEQNFQCFDSSRVASHRCPATVQKLSSRGVEPTSKNRLEHASR